MFLFVSTALVIILPYLLSCDSKVEPHSSATMDYSTTALTTIDILIIDSKVDFYHPALAGLTDSQMMEKTSFTDSQVKKAEGSEIAHGTSVALASLAGNRSSTRYPNILISSIIVADELTVNAGAVIRAINSNQDRNSPTIINLSIGALGPMPMDILEAISRSISNDKIIWVVAAGNHSTNLKKGDSHLCGVDIPNLICVASLGINQSLNYSSNYGPIVDIAAPGELDTDSGIQVENGGTTSIAAGYTSGFIAALWGRNPHLNAFELAILVCDYGNKNRVEGVLCGSI